MNKVIFKNRYLAWAISIAVIVTIFLLWQIKLFEIETEFEITQDYLRYEILIPLR